MGLPPEPRLGAKCVATTGGAVPAAFVALLPAAVLKPDSTGLAVLACDAALDNVLDGVVISDASPLWVEHAASPMSSPIPIVVGCVAPRLDINDVRR
jgi:hypothetical protein